MAGTRSWTWVAAVLALLSAPALAQPTDAPEPDAPASTVATAKDLDNRMTVPVLVNGQGPFQFVVDTASDRSVLSLELAAKLALPPGPSVRVHGAVADAIAPTAKVAALQVGTRRLRNIEAPLLTREDLGADGMLGIDALRNQRVLLNFRTRQMTIQPSVAERPDAGAIVVRGRNQLGQLVFVDATANGAPIYVVLDTGGGLSIANTVLREALAKRNLLTTRVEVISVTGARQPADLATMPHMTIGGASVRNLPLAYADLQAFTQFGLGAHPAMLLGMEVLREFETVTIDFKRRQVTFVLRQGSAQAANE